MTKSDDDLGMNRPIDRRDFINGVAAAVTVGAMGTSGLAASAESAKTLGENYYPPTLQGLRGSHEGSFEAAHSIRDPEGWDGRPAATDTGESYDLIVVGGGISGLAAAYFYREQHGPKARVLILDNHDDFGGHAKRNEFVHNGRTYIGYGGTEQIYHGPWEYSKEALGLLKGVGIDTDRFYTAFDWTRYQRMKLTEGVFFDKETFGRDHLATGERQLPWEEFLAEAPLSDKAKQDIVMLYSNSVDYMPGIPVTEKVKLLENMTYNEFLLNVAKVDPIVVPYFRSRTGRGGPTDQWSALACHTSDAIVYGIDPTSGRLPGLGGMGLPAPYRRDMRYPEQIFHFPDGNAGVARMLVRSLIPSALACKDMEESVTTRVNYNELDRPSSPVRLRVSSTVVKAQHVGAAQNEVEVTYINDGKAHRVRGSRVVMACYNAIIPHICPEMPKQQKEALSQAVKIPLVYINVLVSNWRAWQKLGVHYIHALSGPFEDVKLDYPVDIGTYKSATSPDEPIVLHMETNILDATQRAWEDTAPSTDIERRKLARSVLYGMSFADFERGIRSQLGQMLSPGGFDPANDILGITVNRWPHGYAVGGYDFSVPEAERPHVIGRQRFGRITIANSDAGGIPLTQCAIDQAFRAVKEFS